MIILKAIAILAAAFFLGNWCHLDLHQSLFPFDDDSDFGAWLH